MSASPSEPCSLSLQRVSLRLESQRLLHKFLLLFHGNYFTLCCVFLDTPTLLRKIRVVLGLRCCLSLLCDLFKIDLLKLDDNLGVHCCWPSAPVIRPVQLPLSRRIPSRTTRAARCPAFLVVCNLFLSVSNLSCRLGVLPSLDDLLDLNLQLMFFVLRLPSLESTWLLLQSATVCFTFCCFCVTPFQTSSVLCCCSSSDFLTLCTWFSQLGCYPASQLQSSFQS